MREDRGPEQRIVGFAPLEAAGLILLVERLRGRLGDMLDLWDEVLPD
ncbi:hypothetical protein [Streptomyces sp. AC550_RSS872]|nr:hypothetical protein [Streptomyces sp. AC550_RSS872]